MPEEAEEGMGDLATCNDIMYSHRGSNQITEILKAVEGGYNNAIMQKCFECTFAHSKEQIRVC